MTTISSNSDLPARVAPPRPVSDRPDEVNYDELVISAAKAALLVLGVKVISVLVLAQYFGAPIRFQLWRGVLPHFAFSTSPETFASIVTWSTIAMASAALVLAAATVARTTDRDRQRLWGRLIAGVVVLETLALQIFRQPQGGPSVQWQWSWLVIVTGVAGIILLAVPLWTERRTERSEASRTALINEDAEANIGEQS